MAYFELSGSKGFAVRIHYSEPYYNILSNTSVVQIDNIEFKNDSMMGYPSYLSGYITIGGTNVVTMNSSKAYHGMPAAASTGAWVSMNISKDVAGFPWISNNIEHKPDGSGSTAISVYIKFTNSTNNYDGGIIEGSQNIALMTIPRSSSLTLSKNSVNVEDTIDANITRANESFTHTVEFYVDETYYQKYDSVSTTQSFKIPREWYRSMPTSTSRTAYCRVATYNNGTPVGDPVISLFTITVPSNIIPTVGTITLNPSTINGKNILVKGKNGFGITVSGSSAGIGSTIKSYTFSGPSISKTTTNTSVSISSVSSVGTLTYKVTVTDNRGRTNSSTATIQCYDYYAPSITSFDAYRSQQDGTPDPNGAYLKYTYQVDYASVNKTNNVNVSVWYNDKSSTASDKTIDLNGDINTTYKVHLEVSDSYGGHSVSPVLSVFGQTRVLNITQDGTGIALGKMASSSELFECRWKAKFDNDVEIKGKSLIDLIYPVGSIYMSVNSTSPSTLFGGEWERLEDRFLLGASDTYTAGSEGGEATHKLTVNELPSHNHGVRVNWYNDPSTKNTVSVGGVAAETREVDGRLGIDRGDDSVTITQGGGQAHNNMPPYLAVFMWKRVK